MVVVAAVGLSPLSSLLLLLLLLAAVVVAVVVTYEVCVS